MGKIEAELVGPLSGLNSGSSHSAFVRKCTRSGEPRGRWSSQHPKLCLAAPGSRSRSGRPTRPRTRGTEDPQGAPARASSPTSNVSWEERKSTICSAGVTRSGCSTEAITLCDGGATGRAGNRGQLGAGKGHPGLLHSLPPGSGETFCYPLWRRAVRIQGSRLCRKGISFLKPTSWKKRKENPSNACVWSKEN